MSEDRLKEIKRRPLFEDVPWLISEVERRRLDAVRAQEHMEEYSRDKVQLEAEGERLQQAHTTVVEHYNIACSENERLRGEIKKAITKLDWMLAPGVTRKEAVEILEKAIGLVEKETP